MPDISRKNKKLKWHIDYLSIYSMEGISYLIIDEQNHECEFAKVLRSLTGFSEPVKGFGASDCKCYSHLFYTKNKFDYQEFIKIISENYELKLQ